MSVRRPALRWLWIAILLIGMGSALPAAAQPSYTPALSVGAELGGGTFFYMPYVSFLVNTSLPIIGTHMAVAPDVGVAYLFNTMTGISGRWYIPVGAELSFPDYRLALFARNLIAATNLFGEGGITFGAKAFVPFVTAGKSTFGLTVEVGAAVFWNTTTPPLFLIDLSPALRYDYRVKVFS